MEIQVFQIWYHPAHHAHLDPAFIPVDNSDNPHPDWAEYYLFLQHFNLGRHHNAGLTGLVSWSFFQKTRVTGSRFIEFISENPGYDVYFINPWPTLSQLYPSVWAQGEEKHRGLMTYAQTLFDKLQYPIDLKQLINSEETTLYCNYWVGTAEFWERYIAFTKPVHDLMAASGLRAGSSGYVGQYYRHGMSYYSFVMERMFTTLLTMQKTIRYIGYPYSQEYKQLESKYNSQEDILQRPTMRLARHLTYLPGVDVASRAIMKIGRIGSAALWPPKNRH